MHKNAKIAASVVAIISLANLTTRAWAAPQESITFTSVSSDGLLGATVNTTASTNFAGGYTAYKVRITAQITEVNTNDFGSEGRIYVTPPVGQGFVIQPFTTTSYVGSLFTTANGAGAAAGPAVECVMNLPAGGIPAAGTWSFRFYESSDDAGVDKTWDSLTIQLDDAAPVISSLSGPAFAEVEPNDMGTAGPATVLQPNPNYNLVFPMLPGDTLNGVTTGATTNGAATSIDYYRIEPAPDPFGMYSIFEYTLTITTGGTAGHSGNIRGHSQLSPTVTPQVAGFIDARTDVSFQASITTTSGTLPARANRWYGFGKAGEAILYSINGTASTTAAYSVTLSRIPVTPIAIAGTIVSGPITIARSGHTNTVDMWLYNFNYDPIAGAGADGNATLTRTLAPGVYYLAVSNVNTGNELPSPADSTTRTNNVLNHPNTIANNSSTVLTNMNMSVTSGAGTVSSTGAAKANGFQVVWLTFTVTSVDCNTNTTNDSSEPGYVDCNSNGTYDICDVGLGGAADCNTDNVPDTCQGGCNANGTPDICEIAINPGLDCNTDATLDQCQIIGRDCNTNGTLDACDLTLGGDCNTNSTLDVCEVSSGDSANTNSTALVINNLVNNDSTLTLPNGIVSDVDVGVNIRHSFDGDVDLTLIHHGITITLSDDNGSTGDNYTGTVFDDAATTFITAGTVPFTGTFKPETPLAAMNGQNRNGVWTLRVFDDANGDTGTLLGWTLNVKSTGTDCNTNGLLDPCEGGDANNNGILDACEDCNGNGTGDQAEPGYVDCDTNGTADFCQGPDCNADGTLDICQMVDCNANGTLDECDINGGAADCNTDDVPDSCEMVDCNANGTLDICDVAGASEDCNNDNIPDECQLNFTAVSEHASVDVPKLIPDNNSNGVLSDVVVSGAGNVTDVNVVVNIRHTFDSDLDIALLRVSTTTGVYLAVGNGSSGDNFTNTVFDDEAATGIASGTAPFTGTFKPVQLLSAFDGQPKADTWTLYAADFANIDTGTVLSWKLALSYSVQNDCNANGTPDECDTGADCNTNGTMDECEAGDCDTNGELDVCEIDADPCNALDCNTNDTLDICEVSPPPCAGDLDHDGDVDGTDFGLFLNAYGLSTGDGGFNPEADLDNSGQVNLVDYQLWLQIYLCRNGIPRPPAPSNLGDMNIDGKVDGQDIALFMTKLMNPNQRGFRDQFVMDCNKDDQVNAADMSAFVTILLD